MMSCCNFLAVCLCGFLSRHTKLRCRLSGVGSYSSAHVWNSTLRRTLFILRCLQLFQFINNMPFFCVVASSIPFCLIQFFSDAKESMDYLKNLQDSIQRKYSCDRSSSLHRLEDLIQESMVNTSV